MIFERNRKTGNQMIGMRKEGLYHGMTNGIEIKNGPVLVPEATYMHIKVFCYQICRDKTYYCQTSKTGGQECRHGISRSSTTAEWYYNGFYAWFAQLSKMKIK